MTNPLFRKPRRITITLPYLAYEQLVERSLREGRSISNLAAYLLEASTQPIQSSTHDGLEACHDCGSRSIARR